MKEINITPPEGYEVDKEQSTFKKIVFKKINNRWKQWEELDEVGGYFISDFSETGGINPQPTLKRNRKIFHTLEQAKASIAMAQLSQLMAEVNGNWKPNWYDGDEKKFVIYFLGDHCVWNASHCKQRFLAFPDGKIADKFIETYRELINIAKPLL